jgi:hypothetical protein
VRFRHASSWNEAGPSDCRKRWDWGRNYVNKQITAAEVAQSLGPVGPKPENEWQVRSLAVLPPETRREVWNEAVQASPNGKVREWVGREKARAVKRPAHGKKAKATAKAKSLRARKGPGEPELSFFAKLASRRSECDECHYVIEMRDSSHHAVSGQCPSGRPIDQSRSAGGVARPGEHSTGPLYAHNTGCNPGWDASPNWSRQLIAARRIRPWLA